MEANKQKKQLTRCEEVQDWFGRMVKNESFKTRDFVKLITRFRGSLSNILTLEKSLADLNAFTIGCVSVQSWKPSVSKPFAIKWTCMCTCICKYVYAYLYAFANAYAYEHTNT